MIDTVAGPYCPKIIVDNVIPVHKAHGLEVATCNVAVPRPMPCIVILIHGVNDTGEAYQNQESGIIEGLRKRLDRDDLYPHEWKDFLAMHNEDAQKKIKAPGRSPVIPFYWGYKPVTHQDWKADQQRYREEVNTLRKEAKLPYDAYQEDDPVKMAALGNDGKNSVKFQNDCFKNALDPHYAKNGGTFANATTSIPDMLGPGANGVVVAATGFAPLHFNGGNFTHPVYANPHRIYQFFAAQRLADLIIQIRNNPYTAKDVINIVAHSQGTIITMLANMLVKQSGAEPANCVIMNHSPYSLESRLSENLQDGRHQTDEARQQTFKNFCNLMATQYKGGEHTGDEIKQIEDSGALEAADKNHWHSDARYRRNNNGKVYNYFCTDDGTVSLQNVKGIGWRGIPQEFASGLPNLFQRGFYQHGEVGNKPEGSIFTPAIKRSGDYETPAGMNAAYYYHDVVVNGEALPEPFIFNLQGQDNHPDNDPTTCDIPYHDNVDPDSPDQVISYSAKANALSRTATAHYALDKYDWPELPPGSVLNTRQLAIESINRERRVIKGVITGTPEFKGIQITWLKSRQELDNEWKHTDPVGYSQHSSIVMSRFAPAHAMAFDLAIGQCTAFDLNEGEFWESLLHRADWRDPLNGFADAREYYKTGKLEQRTTKRYMNKPDDILPTGEYGVVNDYGPRERPYVRNRVEIEMGLFPYGSRSMVPVDQWDMPPVLTDSELK